MERSLTMASLPVVTRNFVILTLDYMKKLKNNAFVGNTGQFHNEIDLASSEGLDGMKSTTSSPVDHSSAPLVTV